MFILFISLMFFSSFLNSMEYEGSRKQGFNKNSQNLSELVNSLKIVVNNIKINTYHIKSKISSSDDGAKLNLLYLQKDKILSDIVKKMKENNNFFPITKEIPLLEEFFWCFNKNATKNRVLKDLHDYLEKLTNNNDEVTEAIYNHIKKDKEFNRTVELEQICVKIVSGFITLGTLSFFTALTLQNR